MSLVVFPFKEEDLSVVGKSLEVASSHPRVDQVWAVSAHEDDAMKAVADIATAVGGAEIRVFPQARLGTRRPGKGDAMNTAIGLAASSGVDRVHFYDADITNFGHDWIDGAESAADRGYEIVRHRFPRAATDAMITWMITRPLLAMLFPGTALPRIAQPLGGELLLSGLALERLAADDRVTDRSDWGIDTLITYATTTMGLPVYEHHIADGKRHALYGSLDELRTMLVECLDAACSLEPNPEDAGRLDSDPPAQAPSDLKRTVGFDIEKTLPLLTQDWTDREVELVSSLPEAVSKPLLVNMSEPNFRFMDADLWAPTLRHLTDRFHLGDPAWESLAFRLWLTRVLAYATDQATLGYDHAIAYLEATIRHYEQHPI